MRILIVEDQENLAKLIKDGLEAEGYAVDYLLDGETAHTRIMLHHDDYDLVILDIMLPKKDGLTLCREVREKKIAIPILMLTSKGGADDITTGLNVGADDYLVKPFSFEVLTARIRAILRRPKTSVPVEILVKGLKINSTNKKVLKDGKEIKLTPKEFSLLEYLIRHANQVVGREQIISSLWDFAFDSFSNVVDVHITNLRKKIGDKHGKIIETVHGTGYRITI